MSLDRRAVALVVAIAVAALVGLLVFATGDEDEGGAPVEESPAEAPPPAAAYRLTLEDGGHLVAPGAPAIEAALRLEARVLVQPVESDPRWRQLTVLGVDEVSWSWNDRTVPDAGDRFRGATLFLRTNDDGTVGEVEADADSVPMVVRALEPVAHALAEERLAPGETREGAVRTPFGAARARLDAAPDCSDAPCSFTARHGGDDYTTLEDAASATGEATRTVRLGPDGPTDVRSEEALELTGEGDVPLGDRRILVHLERIDPPEALPRARLRGRRVPVAGLRGDARRRGLEGRVAGLTVAQMLADLEAAQPGARMPDHDGWLWRATGLLQLEPEACDALAEACLTGRLEGRTRQLALELLANVGHAEAQAALREVLGDPRMVEAEDYADMLQRTVLLRAPEDETVTFLAERAEALGGNERRSALSATGAAIGHARQTSPEAGTAEERRLLAALDTADDPMDRRALVQALGNARSTEARPRLIEATQAEGDPGLRSTAARALGRVGGEESSGALAAMLLDEDPTVRHAAIAAMEDAEPTNAQLGVIANAVPSFDRGTRAALVVLAERLLPHSGEALLPLVNALRTAGGLPADAAHRLQRLYRELAGQGPL